MTLIHSHQNFQYLPLKISIRSLIAQHEGAEVCVCVLLEAGEHREERRLTLTTEQYCELKPSCGEIDEETFEILEEASHLCSAIRCGENLLSYGANSVYTLTQKLVQRGFLREIARQAAQKLETMGLIDEEKDLCREFEKCLQKLLGSKRIYAHLWSRGFGNDAMNKVPDLLEKVDFAENCANLIRKHYTEVPTDRIERRRLVASLGRYGYALTEIREAFRILEAEYLTSRQ